MGLIKFRPSSGLTAKEDSFNRILDSFFGFNNIAEANREACFTPRVNIKEDDDAFEISAELPGMKKKEISIEVQDGALAIRGEKNFKKEKENDNYHILERSHGKFERTFMLPEYVDIEKIDAEYNDGVLKVNIPKTEHAKPREVKINVK
ncbi:MAG TPA: Hsp20/alpha crystallin family protein [Candidatus Krumholzibacteriaceae bacterium]|nr:Hsp20/alpha crystallin family protein [Candidatus Krumholzibacteriaceae bacterium]